MIPENYTERRSGVPTGATRLQNHRRSSVVYYRHSFGSGRHCNSYAYHYHTMCYTNVPNAPNFTTLLLHSLLICRRTLLYDRLQPQETNATRRDEVRRKTSRCAADASAQRANVKAYVIDDDVCHSDASYDIDMVMMLDHDWIDARL